VALEVFDARTDVRNLFITPEIRSRIMRFQPGEVSHGHTHDLGHEMFVVLAGQAEFTIAGESGLVGPGQICVARAGEWHEIKVVGDEPMTLYLSVTPHIEPTHTQWDREGGTQLPYRYGGSTRAEREARTSPAEPADVLLDRHLAASSALATSAAANADAQQLAAASLRQALSHGDAAAAHKAIDEMWHSMRTMYARLQELELAWNELAPAVASDA
jgi:quercetin dioxygenase-like cupin family protein